MIELTTISKTEFDTRKSMIMKHRTFVNFDMSEEEIDGEEFIDCNFNFQIFVNSRLSHCTFINCSFYQTSFTDCSLEVCDFIECNLEGSDIKEVVKRMKKAGSNPFIVFDNC